jgi:formylglycine-generating enzyme required for sulfatase activity
VTNYAWYEGNGGFQAHPVGQKLPNPWGLYDMGGNAWEWCQDWWLDSLPGGIAVDPQGPATGEYRVVRGGFAGGAIIWGGAQTCRSAFRTEGDPGEGDFWNGFVGLRVVLAPGQP